MDDSAHLRIGVLSERVGVSPGLLRAWERRYGLLQPSRSAGGFRLYSGADEARVQSMQRYLEAGLPAAEAARLRSRRRGSRRGRAGNRQSTAYRIGGRARGRAGRHSTSLQRTRHLIVCSRRSGSRRCCAKWCSRIRRPWSSLGAGTASVAQEHFASNLLRGRLLGLARGWATQRARGLFSRVRPASSTICR